MQFKMYAVEDESVGEWTSKVEIRTSKKFQAACEACVAVFDLLSQLCVLNRGTLISASALLPLQGFFWGTSRAFFFFFFNIVFIAVYVQAKAMLWSWLQLP